MVVLLTSLGLGPARRHSVGAFARLCPTDDAWDNKQTMEQMLEEG